MTHFRPFRNTDPPALAELWCHHPPLRALVQPMSVDLFERMILSKPYFDRHGLIVAERDGQCLGFVHAGFSADEQGRLTTRQGATCMLMVAPHERGSSLADDLLARSEQYLREAGAERLFGGAVAPADSFYLGLYGGSELPGVLTSDAWLLQQFQRHGYEPLEQRAILQCSLAQLRPSMDRQVREARRRYKVEQQIDPPAGSWWEACSLGQTNRWRFSVTPIAGGPAEAELTFWDLEPLASCWGVHAAGLCQFWLPHPESQGALMQFLIGESLRKLKTEGMTLIETHVQCADTTRLGWLERLGFKAVDQAVTLAKPA